MLNFQKASDNAKLKELAAAIGVLLKHIYTFSLPSGWSCPAARECLSKAHPITGKITDGKEAIFRGYSATDEARSTAARKSRIVNFEQLKHLTEEAMFELIMASINTTRYLCMEVIRVHAAGDYFSEAYFRAWMRAAKSRPDIKMYSYTKSLNYWVANLDIVPDNFNLIASRGGRHDHLIEEYGLREARVIFKPEEAEALGWPIDKDDSIAAIGTGNFCLLLHGTQPAGSVASKAQSDMKKRNIKFSYSRGNK